MKNMSDETLRDLRCYVSDCFNANHGFRDEVGHTLSAYQLLSDLLINEYELHHYHLDGIADDIEELVAKYIMEYSPKFYDNETD
jgi:hypothetical protein